ncbi:hypothetical protein CRP01_31210 [Flavilitoribacter nigricans DSM 23189 = NBRC 102662]|uniref:Uncharacterized protein n=2 Tax=Flavilitoribacter TaxID=2762562 RepID=A0A2D0N2S2_FLAN2|nr:hypothetical protein CRP01_31210 [Flavilitoribacter nigricans DSM 23189 = NBRC 102662]
MQTLKYRISPFLILLFLLPVYGMSGQSGIEPADIKFVRQGVKRLIFDPEQAIPLASLDPGNIIGIASMHPVHQYTSDPATYQLSGDQLRISSEAHSESSIWLGGFNPFATYTLDLEACSGRGALGFEFADKDKKERFIVSIRFDGSQLQDARLQVILDGRTITDSSILLESARGATLPARIRLQMLGSGLNLFFQNEGLPVAIGQVDFSQHLDLRQKRCLSTFQSGLYFDLSDAEVRINGARSELSTGLGQADIRVITYKDGHPLLDEGRLWYTLSIRGRALPHHIQGVFSLDPSVFDLRLEGVIVFDQNDGILRNEISTHLFYDEEADRWMGLTTGFSAYANPDEQKQILAIESKKDPRFGFSIMQARPTGIVGDIEDSHILFDEEAGKWRLLTCENLDGYKAVIMESDTWDRGYRRIAGPVANNSTGTSIEMIDGKRYCFSGSSAREVFVYTYPDLQEAGTLHMDLPPWDDKSGTRIWPNVVELPAGYPTKYIALMMDRYNFPGQKGPHWTYGALYLYHGTPE